jgi:hypothetical protein
MAQMDTNKKDSEWIAAHPCPFVPFVASSSLRLCVSAVTMLLISIAGCVQTPYRFEVHDTGEGSVRVDRVPLDPPVTAATPPATAPSQSDQARISALEAQVKQLSAENQKLKQTTPATVP